MRRPPLAVLTLLLVTACLSTNLLPAAASRALAHDGGAHADPPPVQPAGTDAPIAPPPQPDGAAGEVSALDLIEQGLANGPLFFPYVGRDGGPSALPDNGAPEGPDQPESPGDGHTHDDYYLAEQARLRNEPPFVAPELQAAGPNDPNVIGQWGPVVTWPFVFATAANLPDGRIIAWGGNNVRNFSGGTSTYASIWDPATGQFLSRNHSSHSMFCAIPTMLEDGRVFVNGGDGTRERTSTFDYRTNTWTRVQNMNVGRWYNGAVALPNGQVFTAIGDPGSRYPELWTASTGWTYLTGADLQAPILNFAGYQNNWLPYLFLNRDGRIFHSGPTQQMNWITPTGNGSVANANLTNTWYPKYSTSIMYDEGKILVAGGQVNGSNQAATNQAMVIDLNGATPTKTAIAPMANARKFNNGVVLPNGEVLIVGGNTSGTEFSDNGTVLAPEIWNPTTQTWRAVAPHSVPRNYHSVALLMTDGRVFSGGGGLCNCAADHPDHQIYSPSYLFNADGTPATRPVIGSAPNVVGYGRTITVAATPGLQKFSLIKMSGITHNLNSDLRFLNVPFTETSSGTYALTLHTNRNVMTPGYWMLFALDSQGVPSVAKVVMVTTNDAPVVTNPGSQNTLQGSAVNLQIAAGDPTGDVLTYSASGLPGGLSINPATGLITGAPETSGTYNATVNVSDGVNTAGTTFAWTVTLQGFVRFVKFESLAAANNNPWAGATEFNLLDANNVLLNRSLWQITADSEETVGENGRAINAIDGNPATAWSTQWTTVNPTHPHWLVVDLGAAANVASFRFGQRPELPQEWITSFRFFVSADGVNWGAAVVTGTLPGDQVEPTVALPQTSPPNLVAPAAQTHAAGAAVSLQISATDPDGDPLAYSATGLPGGLTINNNGLIDGTIAGAAGVYTPTVTVKDSRGFGTSVTFGWTVTAPALVLGPMSSAPRAVNTAVTFTASSSNGINVRYKWQFGDGTPETAYSANPSVSYTYGAPGLYLVRVAAIDDRGIEQSTTFVQAIHLPLTAARPAASSSIAYEVRASGPGRLWVVNADNDTVSAFDAQSNNKLAEVAVGAGPRTVAVGNPGTPAAGQVWVTNKLGSSISVLDSSSFGMLRTINLPPGAQPYGVALAPDGSAAYVALEGSGQLLKLDPLTGGVVGSVAVGPNPRHLSVSADGSRVLVARFVTPRLPGENTASVQTTVNGSPVGGEVLAVDAAGMSVIKTVVLQVGDKNDTEVQGRGVPNYLAAPVIAPDGVAAWTPSKQDNVQRGMLRDGNNLNFQNTVRAISSRIDLATLNEDYASRLDHDNSGVGSAAAFDPYGVYLFVALESSREVAVVDVFGRRELLRLAVGRAPQGLAVAPDGTRLYVSNFMDRSVSVLNIDGLVNRGVSTVGSVAGVATLPSVATERLSTQVLLGKQLFYDAKDPRLAADAYISCATCHNDGGQDGRVWDLTGFGEGLRNTIGLRGHGDMGQGPLHWSANFDEVQDFEGQIRNLAGGLGLMSNADFGATQAPLGAPKAGKSAELDALAAYVGSLNAFGPSPFRNGDGTLTSTGAAGKTVFANLNCAACHGGSAFTTSSLANIAGSLQNVGTLKPSSGSRLGGALTGIDAPTLRDVWQTGPYLHDGSAGTLGEAVRAHNSVPAAGGINDSDLAVLVAYLQQIDGSEPAPSSPPPPNQAPAVSLTAPANNATFTQGAAINLAANASDADGTIARVEFYAGTTLLNSDTTAPYSFDWTGAAVGTHVLTAMAYDSANAVTTSAAVSITINAPPPNQAPVVSLTAPANNATFTQGATINLAANASDADGTIARVEFYAGATLLSTDTTAPYSFDWTGAAVGTHVLTAKAYDSANAVSTSTAVNITVNAVSSAGLAGTYFNTVNFSGSPVLQRTEAVNFNWPGSPGAGVNADNISVRWTGRIWAPATGTYYFRTVSDDGVRLWINNTRRINNWTDHAATTNTSGGFTLQGGQWHTVRLDFYERGGTAVIQLLWRLPGTTQYVIIPVTQFSPQ